MTDTPVPAVEALPRRAIEANQAARLGKLLEFIDGRNPFYTKKLARAGVRVGELDLPRDLRHLPFTTKAELIADQDSVPPWGTAMSEPIDRYTRYNQTSSTTGRPLRWLDTGESWQWDARVLEGGLSRGPCRFGPIECSFLFRLVPFLDSGLRLMPRPRSERIVCLREECPARCGSD